MSVRHLQYLFEPKRVALIGASVRAGSLGRTLLSNLCSRGFGGAIYPVKPKSPELKGVPCWPDLAGIPHSLGVARMVADPDYVRAEFAIIVRSDLKRQGLGRRLLAKLINYCRARGLDEIVGETLSQNLALLSLAEASGFAILHGGERGTTRLSRLLGARHHELPGDRA